MKSYRCIICGEVNIGVERPASCPFCGVAQKYVFCLDKVDGERLFKSRSLSDESRKNLISALSFETSNASFYKCASESGESEATRAVFKRLAKLEKEHADIIRKYLDLDPIEFMDEECSTLDIENISSAKGKIKESIMFYKNAAIEAREVAISTLFNALAEVEEGFLKVL